MSADSVLTHRVDGQGDTVLLLNGGFMTVASWDPTAAVLAERYRVVRCDFRGQLRSPGARHFGLAGHVADVVALLDSLGVDHVHALGTSFGAEVALLLAALHPARVTSVIAAAATDVTTPAFADGGRELRRQLERAAEGGDRRALLALIHDVIYSPAYKAAHREELTARAAQVALLPDWWFAGAAGLLAVLEDLDLRSQLGRVACPVLVMAAEEDRIMPVERARALAEALPSARLEVFPRSGHALVVEQPDRFLRSCVDFLASVPRYG
jgi:pimeloyl-ACP methyl ester carboxylesterase